MLESPVRERALESRPGPIPRIAAALAQLRERDGRLRPGARVLLRAFGAGFTWGAGVIEWGGAPHG